MIIADCSGRNPNVFYELGIARTVGRPAILLVQDEQDIRFDVQSFRYIRYNMTKKGIMTPEDKRVFQDELSKHLKACIE